LREESRKGRETQKMRARERERQNLDDKSPSVLGIPTYRPQVLSGLYRKAREGAQNFSPAGLR
jgi:hypothetical protein